EEARRPRQWDRAIPSDLETIVLKAMEHDPADRYGSAQEIADDLRRFLEDRPITAKRPSLLVRVRKWARRHRPLVAAALILVLTTMVLGGVAFWRYRTDQVAQAAERAARQRETERGVSIALAQAETHLAEGEKDLAN